MNTTKQPFITRTSLMQRTSYLLLSFMLVLGLGLMGCKGPTGDQGAKGDKGEQGEQGPKGDIGDPGEDGNANVTLYIFDGHDFTAATTTVAQRDITGLTETELNESDWNVYLVHSSGWIFHLSGYGFGGQTMYFTAHRWVDGDPGYVNFYIEAVDGPGEMYEEIRIIRTAANNVNDQRPPKAASLDYSNYEEVVEYYGLTDEDAVRISSQ